MHTFFPLPVRIIFFVCILLACASCGLLGISKSNEVAVTDPEEREQILSLYENTPEAKRQDSLLARIDAATIEIPADLAQTILIIETYDFPNYVRLNNTRYNDPAIGSRDSADFKKEFAKYQKLKNKWPKHPRYKTVYADQETWEKFDPATHRYVLKHFMRMAKGTDRNELVVYESGNVTAYVAYSVNYLYDRQTGAVFANIEDLRVLEK